MTEEEIKRAKCYNRVLLNKHPYFFRYLYKDTNTKFKKHYSSYDNLCLHVHGLTLNELLNAENKTESQQELLNDYYATMPVIYSNSTMNRLCGYLEGFKKEISQQVAIVDQTDFWKIYQNPNVQCSKTAYNKIKKCIKEHLKERGRSRNVGVYTAELNNKESDNIYFDEVEIFKAKFLAVHNNIDVVVNCLVEFFYQERPKSKKDVLWFAFGDVIFKNVLRKTKGVIKFPIEDKNGDISYLGKTFSWKEVIV